MDEVKRLIDKSVEAFILGLEIYNKPTIKYRVEGFSFFVVNAWELMLKAELIKRNIDIFYKDSDRSLSVVDAVKKIYPDKNTRVRLNLEKIIELRNISTHYITEDYEGKYVPLFQACAINFTNEIFRFHSIDITEKIPRNFITVTTSYEPLDNEQIKLKYTPEVAEKLIKQANEIEILSKTYDSDKFSINIKQNLYITKKKDEADFIVAVNKNSDNRVEIVKELKDPSNTHNYSFNTIITVVSERMSRDNIRMDYEKGFNSYVLNLFIDFYNAKSEPKYAYKHTIGNQEQYTYSQQFVDFVYDEIRRNPLHFVESLKKRKR